MFVFNIFNEQSSQKIKSIRVSEKSVPVRCLSFGPHSHYLVAGTKDHRVVCFNLDASSLVGEVTDAHTKEICGVACSPCGAVVASVSRDGWLIVHDMPHLGACRRLHHAPDALLCVAYSPSGEWLAVGDAAGNVLLFDADDSLTVAINLHKKAVNDLAFSPQLALYSNRESGDALSPGEKRYRLSTASSSSRPSARESTTIARASLAGNNFVAGSPSAAAAATTATSSSSPTLNPATPPSISSPQLRSKQQHDLNQHSVASSDAEDILPLMLATASSDCTACILRVQETIEALRDDHNVDGDIEIAHIVSGHSKELYAVAFSRDGTFVATGSRDKTVRITDTIHGAELEVLREHSDHVHAVCVLPDGELVTGSVDTTVRVHDNVDGYSRGDFASRETHVYSPVEAMAAAPACSRFAQLTAVAGADGYIRFIDYSWSGEQPLYAEAVAVCQGDRGSSNATSRKRRMRSEDDALLEILLSAQLPRFWLPANARGEDALEVAVQIKSRTCVRLILDHLIAVKAEGRLAALPASGNRFLLNLLHITRDMDDLVASFLQGFGLDEAEPIVGEGCEQM
eukprot:UC1_evm1s2148